MFVSKASLTNGSIKSYDLLKRVEVVKDTRKVSKHDMKFNGSTPIMKIDPETFVSRPLSRKSAHSIRLIIDRRFRQMVFTVRPGRRLGLHWLNSILCFRSVFVDVYKIASLTLIVWCI